MLAQWIPEKGVDQPGDTIIHSKAACENQSVTDSELSALPTVHHELEPRKDYFTHAILTIRLVSRPSSSRDQALNTLKGVHSALAEGGIALLYSITRHGWKDVINEFCETGGIVPCSPDYLSTGELTRLAVEAGFKRENIKLVPQAFSFTPVMLKEWMALYENDEIFQEKPKMNDFIDQALGLVVSRDGGIVGEADIVFAMKCSRKKI